MIQLPEGRPWAATSAALNQYLDQAAQDERSDKPHRNYLGGSRLGEACDRALGFEWMHVAPDPGKEFSGRLLRIFERGHDAEARIIRYMRRAGFVVINERKDGGQLGFAVCKDPVSGEARIRGHLDGVVVSGPPIPGITYPCLLEIKCLNKKNWNKVEKDGVREVKPTYYVQQQIYMAYMDLADNPALFVAENADNCTLHAEAVPFNVGAAQTASDRGVRIVSSQTPFELPRIANDSTDFRCKFCAYHARCWSGPGQQYVGTLGGVPMHREAPTPPPPPAPTAQPSWLGHLAQRGADTVNDARVTEPAPFFPNGGVEHAIVEAATAMPSGLAPGMAVAIAPHSIPVQKPPPISAEGQAARAAVAEPVVQAVLAAFPGATVEAVRGPGITSKIEADKPPPAAPEPEPDALDIPAFLVKPQPECAPPVPMTAGVASPAAPAVPSPTTDVAPSASSDADAPKPTPPRAPAKKTSRKVALRSRSKRK